MATIAGGTASHETIDLTRPALSSPNESAVAEALLRCMGRWGLAKTTIEDVAREAGVSRATVYRLFPGGKQSILDAAAQAEVRSLLTEIGEALADLDDLEECLVAAINLAARFLAEHEALGFMRTHEPVALEQVLAFDRLDTLFLSAAALLRPVLARFMAEDRTAAVGVWLTRIVVSYLTTPSNEIDLCDPADVRMLVQNFIMPGVDPGANSSTHQLVPGPGTSI